MNHDRERVLFIVTQFSNLYTTVVHPYFAIGDNCDISTHMLDFGTVVLCF